jgi:prephenate dehydratase
MVPCATAADVFHVLFQGQADVALVPIENSLVGPVVEFYDLLFEYDARIVQEALLRIRHNLIALPGATLEQIASVLSHPVALGQCRRFFQAHPSMKPVAHYDTAGSVRTIAQAGGPSQAAIASRQAAEQYGGVVLLADIEDDPENYTRFLLIQRKTDATALVRPQAPASEGPPRASNKMSLLFFLENRPGALVRALETFAGLDLNLTKIESRPVRGRPWEYMFYADVQLPSMEAGDAALQRLQQECPMVKELGRYRAAAL